MDGGLDLFKCKNSPLDQDSILKLVLKYVGADIDDLLECRLVNRSWNQAAIHELEQHGYALEMDYEKMVKFRSLLWKSRMSRSQIAQSQSGFSGLSFTDHHQLASLRLSLKIEVVENSSEHANEMGEVAQLLLFYSQLRVAVINCSYNASFTGSSALLTNHELFNVLSLTSSTLTRIRICVDGRTCSCGMGKSKAPSFEDFDFNESTGTLEFPKLTSLRYQLAYPDVHNNDMVDTTRHVLSIVKKSPNLTNLYLKILEGDRNKSVNCLQKLIQPCAANLEQLTVRFGDEDSDDLILNTLSDMKFPKLIRLELSNFLIGENTKYVEFTQHLKTNCPLLTHFVLPSTYIDSSPGEPAGLQLEFPTLQNITHFGFSTSSVPGDMRAAYFQNVHATFTKMMRFYPGLIVMRLGLRVLLMLGAHLKGSGQLVPSRDQFPIFPTISTLEVKMCGYYDMLDLADRQIYHHTFPNIQKLVIKLQGFILPSPDKEQLTQVLAFLCNHPEIREIEIQNYAQPLFEEMAEANLNLVNWKGVKSLKMFPPKSGEYPELNLPAILTQLPKLEFLQFGKVMIYDTQIQAIRSSFILKNPISKFRKAVSCCSIP